MKKQLNQLRRFFARTGTRKLNAATAREAISASYDDDDSSNRLSGAFIIVLVLHVIALVGVFAFSRMKDPKPYAPTPNSKQQATIDGSGVSTREEAAPPTPDAVNTAPPAVQYASLQSAKPPSTALELQRTTFEPSRSAPRAGNRAYVVKNGDNLTRIAVAYGVRTEDLITANQLKGDEIKPGQELVIPDAKSARSVAEQKPSTKLPEKAAPTKPAPATHKVRKNETLAKIARDLGVNYDDLTKLNGIKDPRKLQEGQVLKVPKKG
jgi:LysM repeat protein